MNFYFSGYIINISWLLVNIKWLPKNYGTSYPILYVVTILVFSGYIINI